jgi:hypothetical protein
MKANGWQGAPIDVVRMADGGLTAVDNTRVLAAALTRTPVQAVVRGFDEVFPAARAAGNLQGATWGEAVMSRIAGQKPGWQQLYPTVRCSPVFILQRRDFRHERRSVLAIGR